MTGTFIHLTDAIKEAVEMALEESHYTNEPCFCGIDYGNGYVWFTMVTYDWSRWGHA